jgi:hypothetical protein
MQTMSSAWMPAMLATTLEVYTYGEIWTPPSSGAPNGQLVGAMQVTTGNVVIDATNAIRRTCAQVTLIPYGIDPGQGSSMTVPEVDTDALFPDGNELILYKGVRYTNGSTEVATLGRFLMEDVEVYKTSSTGVYIELNGRDRGGTISRDKFTSPYATDGVSTLPVQLQTLINSQVPFLTYNITPTTFVPAAMNWNINDDPWSAALAVAAAGGYELFPDPSGIIVARPTLNTLTTSPSASYAGAGIGGADSILTSVQRSLVTSTVPNIIVVQSQGSGVTTPLTSYWWDSNPDSPTFYSATVPVPGSNMTALPSKDPGSTYPTTSNTITTQAATTQLQSDSIAQSAGYGVLGTIESIDFKIRDNPAHDVDDVVQLQDDDVIISPTLYCLDTITIQLDASQELEAKGRLVPTPAAA